MSGADMELRVGILKEAMIKHKHRSLSTFNIFLLNSIEQNSSMELSKNSKLVKAL